MRFLHNLLPSKKEIVVFYYYMYTLLLLALLSYGILFSSSWEEKIAIIATLIVLIFLYPVPDTKRSGKKDKNRNDATSEKVTQFHDRSFEEVKKKRKRKRRKATKNKSLPQQLVIETLYHDEKCKQSKVFQPLSVSIAERIESKSKTVESISTKKQPVPTSDRKKYSTSTEFESVNQSLTDEDSTVIEAKAPENISTYLESLRVRVGIENTNEAVL